MSSSEEEFVVDETSEDDIEPEPEPEPDSSSDPEITPSKARASPMRRRRRLSNLAAKGRSIPTRQARRVLRSRIATRKRRLSTGHEEQVNDDENTVTPRKKITRVRKKINYQILPLTSVQDEIEKASRDSNVKLFKTSGPFGGNEETKVLLSSGGPDAENSSDDDLFGKLQGNESTDRRGSAPADSDPLGIDTNIDFSAVGGLDSYIDQLKEMIELPLKYPEVYKRFGITPPRGVLFHGPPGTGKTLMARALASSCSASGGKKVTFFMRKGADCLSKWVGEAERQLRLLFTEAKNQQPSIIFFDEIDGLAPVRSSKQEQIHASIVSTLLALMDGMDNRGQVIVIGATNRPDSVDPALRRPGRFDREFYFPLPDLEARKKIIQIHTNVWDPPLKKPFIEHIARLTKGYGGADLRALCTESALSAIQHRYPQIYRSKEKLQIDPSTIHVKARDVLKSVNKITPSSARTISSIANPLPTKVEILLDSHLRKLISVVDKLLPCNKPLSPLDEALIECSEDEQNDGGFSKLEAFRELQTSRVFRPRLLLYGSTGMGQTYLASAILHHLEGYFIQSLDLGTLYSDSSVSPEAMLIQLLVETKKRTPSVIFVPNIDEWLKSLSVTAKSTFFNFVKSLNPNDAILILAYIENDEQIIDYDTRSLFGFSTENIQVIEPISKKARKRFLGKILNYVSSTPLEYSNKSPKPKVLEHLPIVIDYSHDLKPDDTEKKRKALQIRNKLKIKLSGIIEPLLSRYKKFKKPIIDSDLVIDAIQAKSSPNNDNAKSYETENGMILEISTGKRYYNMDLNVIEERLWNGFYLHPKQFLSDIKKIHKDANTSQVRDRIVTASEMLTNAEVFIDELITDEGFIKECEYLVQYNKSIQNPQQIKSPSPPPQNDDKQITYIADDDKQDIEPAIDLSKSSPPELKMSIDKYNRFKEKLVLKTDNQSVERLEQIYSYLVDTFWHHKDNWDRDFIISMLSKSLDSILESINEISTV